MSSAGLRAPGVDRRQPALLIAGHGTRSAEGVGQFTSLVERIRRRAAPLDVGGGFIELARPPLTEAVATLTAAGHRQFGVVPLVLVSAGHAKGDIPGALAREQQRHPGTAFAYGRPLGPHPVLLDLLALRLAAVVPSAQWPDTAVVLVGRGTSDPDANGEVAKVARMLFEGRGLGDVQPAWVSLARPSVPEMLERCRRLGARRIVVLPYFLFPGVLPDRITAQAAAFAASHPELDVRCAPVIGDCDELADLVLERYREALAGDLRMNCDTCQYRTALPGFSSRVGQPQTPHFHPDDDENAGHGHGHSPNHEHSHRHRT